MNCPGCTLEMSAESYAGTYGRAVELDVCHHCNGLWFEGRESLLLSPAATLDLFRSLAGRQAGARATLVRDKRCPACAEPLRETHNMQRATRFTYFECGTHGRYTTFFHFLREKNLLRAPTPKQLAELKKRVKVVQCSNCGAPIELARGEACAHCAAPVSILSTETLEQSVKQLKEKAERRVKDPGALAAELALTRERVERELREEELRQGAELATDLVMTGLRLFLRL